MRWAILIGLLCVLALPVIATRSFQPRESAVVASELIIPPGREQAVVRWLDPVMRDGFSELAVKGVAIEGQEVRILLKSDAATPPPCKGAPSWLASPGALVVTRLREPSIAGMSGAGNLKFGDSRMAWMLCGRDAETAQHPAETLLALLDRSYDGNVWARVGEDAGSGMVAATGAARPGQLTQASWLLTLAASVAVALFVGRKRTFWTLEKGQLDRWVMAPIALAIVGVFLRVVAAAAIPLDSDEGWWSGPSALSVFGDDHDALIHPPLFRAVQQAWVHGIQWAEQDPLWMLRVPSLVAALATLLVVLMAIQFAGKTRWRWLAAIPFCVAPSIVEASVLARPYAIAAMLVGFTILGSWIRPRSEPYAAAVARWTLVICAAALAAWADLLAGAVALLAISLPLIERPVRWREFLVPVVALAGWAVLLPGALLASTTGVLPGIEPGWGMSDGEFLESLRMICAFNLLGTADAGLGWLGFASASAMAFVGVRTRRPLLVLPLIAVLVAASLDVWLVRMRVRNVLFLPVATAVALAISADPILAWVKRVKRVRRAESS